MAARKFHSFFTFFLILVLCFNLLNVQTVLADGETPTEPPAATEVGTEPTEEPTVLPTETPAEETPTPIDVLPTEATPDPVETGATPSPVVEALTQVPEGTEVVVIDEDGDVVPLAAEAAVDIAEAFDPMWCPAGVLPGGAGCTINFASIGALITDMINNTNTYTQNGIIYFVATTGPQTTGASLNLTTTGLNTNDFNTLNDYNLTLQGGWNGQNGSSATFTGTTNFGTNTLTVGSSANPWAGNVTVNNFSFNGVSSTNSITIYTTSGDITVNDVNVSQQAGENYAALLNSTSGDITIDDSTFDGDNTGGDESLGVSATTGAGSIAISDTTFQQASQNGGSFSNGATLSASAVTLTNVTATQNDGNGIAISNASQVNLTNVTSGPNTNGAGNGRSGVLVTGTGSTVVSVGGGVFADNGRYGIEVTGGSIFIRSNPTCPTTGNTSNGLGCYTPNPSTDPTPPVITPSISGTAGANGWYTSNVTVSWAVSDPQSGILSSTCTTTNLTSETAGTSLTCSATNGAGLTTNASPVIIKIDKTAPSVTLQVTAGTAGANGWYTSDVTISTVGTDLVSTPVTCTADQFQTSETSGANFNGSCTNNAGLSAAASITVKLDKTNPSIAFNSRTAPNASGWNNTNVTVNWTCTDQFSGPAAASVSQIVSMEGAGQSATGTCSDLAGNSASDTQGGINIDKTAPSLNLPTDITAEATSSAGANVSYTATVNDNLDPNVTIVCNPASNSLFPLGQTQVGCSSTDRADNTASGSFLVNVGDTTGPIIAFHADVTEEATSASGALVNYTSPTASDAVEGPIATVDCQPASGTVFALGDTMVTCSAQDSVPNISTSTFTVHVVDTTGPVIAFHADVTQEAISPAGATVTYTSPTALDAVDGAGPVSCTPASDSVFALGDTTVTCTATDSQANTAQSTFTVHVVDTTGPVIQKPGNIIVEATGPGGTIVNYDIPAAVDAVTQNVAVNCQPASATQFPLGTTTVECNAMDEAQNQASPVTFTVTVRDTTAPQFDAFPSINVPATSAAGAVATFTVTAQDTVDLNVTVVCNPPSGSLFPIGATQVACAASDDSGNETNGSFFVNVYDPAGPILSLPGNLTVEATSASGATVNFSATAIDLGDGSVPVTCTPASGSSFGFGTTQVSCTASDSEEHTNEGSFFVTVQDTTAPVIMAHADFDTLTEDPAGVIVTYASPAFLDAVDGPGTATCLPASGTTFPIGTTTVTCSATDSHGNTASTTFLVRVELSTPGPIDPGTETSAGGSSAIIPLTGGELLDLDCNSVMWAYGIKLSFFNLCDHQTALNSLGAGNLPGELPNGYSFVMGLNVDVLNQGQLIDELPEGAGVELDFPTYGQSLGDFAVLFWSESEGKWIEVTARIDSDELTQTLSEDGDLYQVLDGSLSAVFYQMLTTQDTGTFVLVKK